MTKPIKNILLFTSEFPPLPGGIGNHAYNLARNLDLKGYKVTVIADQRSASREEEQFDNQLSFEVRRIKLLKLRFLMYFKRIFIFFRLVSKHDLFISSGKFPLWIGAFSKYFFRKRTIAIIHGSEVNFTNEKLKKSIDFSLKKYDEIIAVSNYTKSLIQHLQLDNITVIPNGFDSSSWQLIDEQSKALKGSPSLLTVGNVTERKGQLNVIKHLPRLKQDFPDVHYHCVGFPTQKDEFLDVAKTLNVESNITFYGSVNHKELQEFYQSVDIFVMLSNRTKTGDVEGFGIAVIEANYFGLPAIGSKGCGIEDAIDDYNSGILIEGKEEEQFALAVKKINEDYSVYNEKSRQWALKHTWEKVIEDYLKVINS